MINYNVDLLMRVKNDIENWSSILENQAKQVFTACENMLYSLEQEIKLVAQQISMLNAELTMTTNAIKMNNQTKTKAKSQISSANQEISQLKKQASQIDSQKNSAESSSEKSNLEAKKKQIENTITSMKKNIADLEKKVEKVNENNPRLEHIASTIREELHKCYEHQNDLNEENSQMKIAYATFRNDLYPRIKGIIQSEICPKIEETIEKGRNLSKSLLCLADREGYSYYSASVEIDSGVSFLNMAKKMEQSVNELRSSLVRCENSTSLFSHNLNDRVSQVASNVVNASSTNIKNVTISYFDTAISNMKEVYRLCKEYEEISVNANI